MACGIVWHMAHRSTRTEGLYNPLADPTTGTYRAPMPMFSLLVPLVTVQPGPEEGPPATMTFTAKPAELVPRTVPSDCLDRFVNLSDDADAIIAFAREFGPLGVEGEKSTIHGRPVTRQGDTCTVELIKGGGASSSISGCCSASLTR